MRETTSMSTLTTPLTEADLDWLDLLLRRVNPEAMSLPELDGFFCALVCGPSMEPVGAYFPFVLGQDHDHDSARYSLADPEELSTLLIRHWNEIAAAMLADEPYMPLFGQDMPDNPVGDEWARDFVEGMDYDQEEWNALTSHKHNWTLVAPVMLLLANSDPGLDSELKRPLDTPEKRTEVLAAAAVSLSLIFRHFHPAAVKSSSKRK
jgi:uncharacterized protein